MLWSERYDGTYDQILELWPRLHRLRRVSHEVVVCFYDGSDTMLIAIDDDLREMPTARRKWGHPLVFTLAREGLWGR